MHPLADLVGQFPQGLERDRWIVKENTVFQIQSASLFHFFANDSKPIFG
jgi:hypothetical protein